MPELQTLSLRMYLTIKTMEATSVDWFTATEAVTSTMLAHPEWDWDADERRTYDEWEQQLRERGLT